MFVVLDVLHGVVLLLAIFLLGVLLFYESGVRTSLAQKYERTVRGSILGPGKSIAQIIGKWLRVLCIICAALCACICLNDLVYYNAKMRSSAQCTAPRNLGVALLTTLDMCIYLFLWLRQYLVYNSLQFDRKFVRHIICILKWGTLLFIIGSFLTTNSLIACCRRYYYNATSERCSETTPKVVDLTISYMWSVGSVILHCTLVLMFAFPLTKLANQKININNSSDSKTASQKRMLALVYRCLAMSFACVSTDIFVMLLTSYALKSRGLSQLRHLLYNINVLLDCIFIVASFKEWKQMLFPCVKKKAKIRANSGPCTTTFQMGKEQVVGPVSTQ